MTIEELLADATRRMDRAIEATRDHLNSVRTGRASSNLLDAVLVTTRQRAQDVKAVVDALKAEGLDTLV